ncbi:hypothetical protein GCM10009601_35540 [Streptomyces thermospinosisporus]|uniref:Transposase n=1 Tax=Streptomyces thermospinosisporus TaxID=161482 RepID=A0ABN1Z0E9_9ACTN
MDEFRFLKALTVPGPEKGSVCPSEALWCPDWCPRPTAAPRLSEGLLWPRGQGSLRDFCGLGTEGDQTPLYRHPRKGSAFNAHPWR